MANRLELKQLEARPKADMHDYRARIPKGVYRALQRKTRIDGMSVNRAVNIMVKAYIMNRISVLELEERDS